MKLTRRELGVAAGVVVLTPVAVLAQAPAQAPPQQRDWLAEARESHAAAARAIARVEVGMTVQPAFRFTA